MAIRAPNHRLRTGLVRWEHLGLVFPAKREAQFRIKLPLWPHQRDPFSRIQWIAALGNLHQSLLLISKIF